MSSGNHAAIAHIRLREKSNQLGYRGVDSAGGNLVIGQGKTGCRVIDRRIRHADPRSGSRAEVADAFVIQRHGGDAANALRNARAFVVEEVEQLVFLDRAAQATAELILVILRTAQMVAIREEVVGVEVVVTQVFEEQPMHPVGTALCIYRNDSAGTPAVFRRVGIGDDVEFLNHVDRGV